MSNRVVITGLGVISPVGTGKDVFWKSLLEGKNGIDKITRFDASVRLKLIDRNIVIQDAMENEVSKEDAELLSYFYNDGELIADILSDEDEEHKS